MAGRMLKVDVILFDLSPSEATNLTSAEPNCSVARTLICTLQCTLYCTSYIYVMYL